MTNQREHELVRKMRMELLVAQLITAEEYAALEQEYGGRSVVAELKTVLQSLRPSCKCEHLLHKQNFKRCSVAGCMCRVDHRLGSARYAEIRWDALYKFMKRVGT